MHADHFINDSVYDSKGFIILYMPCECTFYIYSNKKETSNSHGTVSLDPIKMSQEKQNQNVYQTSDTQTFVII